MPGNYHMQVLFSFSGALKQGHLFSSDFTLPLDEAAFLRVVEIEHKKVIQLHGLDPSSPRFALATSPSAILATIQQLRLAIYIMRNLVGDERKPGSSEKWIDARDKFREWRQERDIQNLRESHRGDPPAKQIEHQS